MTSSIPDVVDLLEELVKIDSVNPAIEASSPGEAEIGAYLADVLRRLGVDVSFHDVIDGRANVVGVLEGEGRLPAVLLEAHLDTVAHPAGGNRVVREGNRLYGRGTSDTKGSLAAMIGAVAEFASRRGSRPTVVIAGVVDEEFILRGARALADQIPEVAGAVVGEPTSLRPIRAHNGMARFTIRVRGRSAHTSKAHLGANALTTAARIVVALEDELGSRLRTQQQPLTGPAMLTPAVIHGGTADNMVPDTCVIRLDRRLSPWEDPDRALAEIDSVVSRVPTGGCEVIREDPLLLLPGVETPADHPLIRAAELAAEEVLGVAVSAGGVPYGTDACYLTKSGIPTVVLGPGSIDQAHADEEWVDIGEVRRAVDLYVRVVEIFTERAS